jgi:hypothetical protein
MIGGVVGVAYLRLTVHVPFTASGVVNEQVVPVRLNVLPIRFVTVSDVICNGDAPVFVTVTTLVTGARGLGIVKVRLRPRSPVESVPFVAAV